MHQSTSKIPPENLVKYNALVKQTPISNIFLKRIIKRFGFSQLGTYLKTRKRNQKITFPYMPIIDSKNIFLYDFHIHTKWSDGNGSYKDILNQIYEKKHLNGGLAITDHPFKPGSNKYLRYIDEKAIKRSFQFNSVLKDFKERKKLPNHFISFPGSCEFLTRFEERDPIDIEIIALGVSKDFIEINKGIRNITNNVYAVELIEKIHDDNGLVILPHPFYYTKTYEILRKNLTKNSIPDAFEGLNYSIGFLSDKAYREFFEKLPFSNQLKTISILFGYFNWMATIISQNNQYGKHFDYPIARKIASIGSSDAHMLSMVGAACTMIYKNPISSIEDLRKVFKKKETTPIYNPLWKQNTKKTEVYNDLWYLYGEIIKGDLSKIRRKPFLKLYLAKFIIDLFSLLFE